MSADARQLNQAGNQALAAKDFAGARALFEQAAALDDAPQLLLNLAFAARGQGDFKAELDALDRALALDPYFQLALFQRGEWLFTHADRPAAATAFGRFLATLAPDEQLSPGLRGAADHARRVVTAERDALAVSVERAFEGEMLSPRIAESAAIAVGRADIYRSQPSGMYIPFLPEVPFFDRALFPWFAELEAATPAITEELVAVLAADAGLEPYVAFDPTQPVNQWRALNHSRDWSAFFLWRDGRTVADHCARCPKTTALLDTLPILRLPGRGPTAMFSILTPGAHIPPHTGATNSRAVVHLPLIVPDGCGFRVGSTTREWVPGVAWAFDDTIEHEAWNRGTTPRAILILDAWNPYLDETEHDQIERLLAAMGAHAAQADWEV